MNSAKQPIKILHICQDEKFMDGVIYLFNKAFAEQNYFLVVLSPAIKKPRYIKSISKNIKTITYNSRTVEFLKSQLIKFDLIVLHGLNATTAELVLQSSIKGKFMWSVLGAELYQNKLIYKKSLLAYNTNLVAKSIDTRINLKERLKNIYRKIRYSKSQSDANPHELIAAAVRQVDCIASLVREEFEYLKNNSLLKPEATYQLLTYYPIEYFDKNSSRDTSIGKNLLIGNSASYTNNHLELFDILETLELEDRKIIVPLSYGNKKYQREVIKNGKKLLGSRFFPLVKFIPLTEYNELISTCSITIMNHHRQQGVGNILQSLWAGRKVFLSERNVLFTYFTRIGCIVFSIEKALVKENEKALVPLTNAEVEHNRAILKREISEKALVAKLREGLKELCLN